jgi:dipeptidase E
MKLYLSSYRVGNHSDELLAFLGDNRHVAVIGNAMDGMSSSDRQEHVEHTIATLSDLGLLVEEVDLRDYFGKADQLAKKLDEYRGVWVRGGNVFILRRAMSYTGMDRYVQAKVSDPHFVYAGYSAGVCLLGPSLHGLEIVDEPHRIPDKYQSEIIWEGLNILDYVIVPHYKSDHPESAMIDKTVEHMLVHNIVHKTLRDGEVIVTEAKI